jgi:hypothetical protein
MPAKKPKPLAETYPLKLTEKQRESLIHATRLKRGIKDRLEHVAAGSQAVPFTKRELEQACDEVYKSMPLAPNPHKQRLNAVLHKIEDFLDALEEQPVQEKRQAAGKSGVIYQFKVTLKGSNPTIWRRFQAPDGTLGQLHEVLQVVMGWQDSHMHQFIVRGEYYGPRPPDDLDMDMDMDMETEDEEDILISQVAEMGRKVRLTYEYDFGDGWQHDIVLEKSLEPEPKVKYPKCVEGARACPPEDCGGIWGYADFLEAIADPKHENHRDMKEWIGGKFDPEKFSVEVVNKGLRQSF